MRRALFAIRRAASGREKAHLQAVPQALSAAIRHSPIGDDRLADRRPLDEYGAVDALIRIKHRGMRFVGRGVGQASRSARLA
ncbi:hypothetical protein CKO23_17230 [Thiocystis violacea]|nr:hypothetical protein [Thiocystis violacea]